MKMTMNEYVKQLISELPEPTTIRQTFVEKISADILKELRAKGEAEVCYGRNDGNREVLITSGRRVRDAFEEKGYIVEMCENAESNTRCYFWIRVKS